MKIRLLVLFYFLACIASAQTLEKFNYLQSSGNFPEDFTLSFEAQFRRDIAKIPVDESAEMRAQKATFFAQSDYFIQQMLFSGKVTFNDPISNYAARIADILLKDDWEFRQKLRFYTIKSDVVNAFTTNSGIIFLTTGLVARLENEAQLAFVLCHEMVHYKNAHVLTGFLNNGKIDKKAGVIKLFEMQQRQLEKLSFSRDLELEADAEGMLLFKESGYSPWQAIEALRLIEQNETPFYTSAPAWDVLEGAHIIIPDSIKKKNVQPCTIEVDQNDSISTHPNTLKRIAKLDDLNLSQDTTNKLFLYSQVEFETICALAKLEVIRQNLIQTQYDFALYEALNMAATYPNIPFLKKAILKSLYQMYVFALDKKSEPIWRGKIDTCSNISLLGEYFNTLNLKAFNQLALFTGLEMLNQFPDDTEIQWLCFELKRLLQAEHHLKIAIEFEAEPFQLKAQTIAGNMLDERFYSDNLEGLISAYTANPEYNSAVSFLFSIQQDTVDAKTVNHSNTIGLVAPRVTFYNENKDNYSGYLVAEQLNTSFKKSLHAFTAVTDSSVVIFDFNKTAAELNRISLLNDWQEEFLLHDGLKTRLSAQENIEPICQLLGINKFGWMMHVGIKPAKWKRIVKGCCYSAMLVTLPLGIYYFLKPENMYYYSYTVFDTSRQKRLISRETTVNKKINLARINTNTRNSFEIKSKN